MKKPSSEIRDTAAITIREAAKLMGICKNSAYAAARRNEIPVIHLGRRLVVPIAGLERMGIAVDGSHTRPIGQADEGDTQ